MVNSSEILTAIGAISVSFADLSAFPFTPNFNIGAVVRSTEGMTTNSWEYGTLTEALLELYNPELSVFGDNPFPVPTLNRSDVRALTYLAPRVKFGSSYNALFGGAGAGGAAADPASMGVGAVMLGKTDAPFARAATQTVQGLLDDVPRFWNGAISHRPNTAELWADFMYMVPPFLAYYAADTQDEGLLKESVEQCSLYRQVLQANITDRWKGVWQHIIGPESHDPGLWSTGNAWAAAGMARVLATVVKSDWVRDSAWKKNAVDSLTQYIKEIVGGAMHAPKDQGLLRNYLNDLNARGRGFGEVSGSALLAATAYRMAVLQPSIFNRPYIAWAESIRRVLGGQDSHKVPHVLANGTVKPVVNPYGWMDLRPYHQGSPEGNSFVMLLYAAWRDCVKAGNCPSTDGAEFLVVQSTWDRNPTCFLRNRHRHRNRQRH